MEVLEQQGLQSKADPCLFCKSSMVRQIWLRSLTWILADTKDKATMNRFTTGLRCKFKPNDMGDAKYEMGCHTTRNRKARKVKLDQTLYAKTMAEKYGIKKENRVLAVSGMPTISKADEPRTPEEAKEIKTAL